MHQAQTDAPDTIEWQIRIHATHAQYHGDAHLLARALSNLLNNAKKFARQHIDVIFEQTAEQYIISVADDGDGIPEEHRAQIFQAFYRLDQSRNRETGGYGLGLAIVESIAQAYQGNAYVTTSQYGGACFQIAWPITLNNAS